MNTSFIQSRRNSVTPPRACHSRAGCVMLIASIALILGGCTMGPDYQRPATGLSRAYNATGAGATTEPSQSIDGPWWELFQDPTLNALQESALSGNLDLRAAAARVTQARATARSAGSAIYPEVGFNPSASRSRNAPGRDESGGSTRNSFRIPLDLSYEIDLWGRVRRTVESANANARGAEMEYQFVRQTLHADIAVNYFFYRYQLDQEHILTRTLDAYQKQIELNQKLVNAKFGSPSALAQAQVQLQSTIVQRMEAQRQREGALHTLAVLVGKSPSEFTLDLRSGPTMVPRIPPGLPSELLRRRPDVALAEQNLIAANAEIGVAEAAFFPQVELTGLAGFESADLAHAMDWRQRVWSVGAGATIPLFNAGRLSANLERTTARHAELTSVYQKSVLNAIQDVEDALVDLHSRSQQARAQEDALIAAREYLRLSILQYQQGLISYLQVVDAERTLQSNELLASQILNQRLTATVVLIKSLGGGWNPDAPSTPPSPNK